MADGFGSIRSYQRIFRPDRRIFQIDNHRLPVPGGVPLGCLGYAVTTLLAVVVLSTRGEGLLILAGLAAAAAGWMAGGSVGAVLAAATAIVSAFVTGAVLSVLDWPLRLLVVPAMVATLLTQATPDGRPARRYVASWVGLQLRAPRRSAGRPLPVAGVALVFGARLWIAADQRFPWLRRGFVTGPAMVEFARPLPVRLLRWPRRCSVVKPAAGKWRWRRAAVVDGVSLDTRERLEVRP